MGGKNNKMIKGIIKTKHTQEKRAIPVAHDKALMLSSTAFPLR